MRSPILIPILAYLVQTFARDQEYPTSLRVCAKNQLIEFKLSNSNSNNVDSNRESLTACQCNVEPLDNARNDSFARDDYSYASGIGFHKLHLNAKNWNEARKICNDEGGHLAVLNSAREETVLLNMLKNNANRIKGALNREEALLGIHDMFKEDEWVTVFGESLDRTGYINWSTTYWNGQPDNYLGNQNCGALVDQGGMDDVFCHDKFAFFCEIPIGC